MARTLNTTVLVDGQVYEAGTREEDINGSVVAEGVWDGEAQPGTPVPASVAAVDDSVHPNTDSLRELVEYLAELHLADKEVSISDLLKSATEVFGDPEDEAVGDGGDDEVPDGSGDETTVSYAEKSLADLKSDAESRGLEFKGSGANGNVVKADQDALVAALEAHDAAKA